MRQMVVKARIGVPRDNPLVAATEHALRQWDEIPRIFASTTYKLDNNEVERINRYISLTCHRCGVYVFDYFCDIIDRCIAWSLNTPIEKYRDLLPARWEPSQKKPSKIWTAIILERTCYRERL